MKLGIFNSKNVCLNNELSKSFNVVDITSKLEKDLDAVFIDWIPTEQKQAGSSLKQMMLATDFAKKKPAIIFDRFLSITPKEYELLVKNNVYFFEPAIKYRPGFSWMPFSTAIKDIKTVPLDEEKSRSYNLIYRGNLTDKIKSFEKYYIDFARVYPSIGKVVYDGLLDKEKAKEYRTLEVNQVSANHKEARVSMIIGSPKDYMIGHLDNNFIEALENGCLPLIPVEHRFFANLQTVTRTVDTLFYLNAYNMTSFGIILDFYTRMREFYPEMDVRYSVDQIKYILK